MLSPILQEEKMLIVPDEKTDVERSKSVQGNQQRKQYCIIEAGQRRFLWKVKRSIVTVIENGATCV